MWGWGGETRGRSWGAGSVLFLGGCSFCDESLSCLLSLPNNISKKTQHGSEESPLAVPSHHFLPAPSHTVKNNLLSIQCMSLLS